MDSRSLASVTDMADIQPRYGMDTARLTRLTNLGKRDLVLLLETVNHSLSIRTEQEFRELILSLERVLPMEGVVSIMSKLAPGSNPEKAAHIINIGYPDEWLKLYLDNQYAAIDPIIRNHIGQFKPQIWSQTFKKNTTPAEKAFVDQAREFNLDEGLTLGHVCRRTSVASLLSFQGHQIVSHPRHVAVLEYLTPYLHNSLATLSLAPPTLNPRLSGREREILQWVMMGKTNWEISVILNISERTVKFHMQNAMGKLGASTRAHLVAIAAKEGLIEL